MNSTQFINERTKKIFITNHAPDCSPLELLSAAMGSLSGLKNTITGQKIWQIDRPLPLGASRPRALHVFAQAHYPVSSIAGTVGLTLGAIPENDVNIQIMAHLEDSMGWDIPISEQIADVAMVQINRGITARYPQHGGWAMTAGAWRIGHHFSAPEGIPPNPPSSSVAAEQAEKPEDFFSNPATARVWEGVFPLVPAQSVVNLAFQALTRQDQAWNLEPFTEPFNGVPIPHLAGQRPLPTGGALYLHIYCQQEGNALLLIAQFAADAGYWITVSTKQAMERTAAQMNTVLQQQYGVVLRLVPPR